MFMGDMKFTTAGDFLASQKTLGIECFGEQTFNSDNEYTPLIEGIRDIMPKVQEMYKT